MLSRFLNFKMSSKSTTVTPLNLSQKAYIDFRAAKKIVPLCYKVYMLTYFGKYSKYSESYEKDHS